MLVLNSQPVTARLLGGKFDGILPHPWTWCTCTAVLLLSSRAALTWKLQKSLVYMRDSYRAAAHTRDVLFINSAGGHAAVMGRVMQALPRKLDQYFSNKQGRNKESRLAPRKAYDATFNKILTLLVLPSIS